MFLPNLKFFCYCSLLYPPAYTHSDLPRLTPSSTDCIPFSPASVTVSFLPLNPSPSPSPDPRGFPSRERTGPAARICTICRPRRHSCFPCILRRSWRRPGMGARRWRQIGDGIAQIVASAGDGSGRRRHWETGELHPSLGFILCHRPVVRLSASAAPPPTAAVIAPACGSAAAPPRRPSRRRCPGLLPLLPPQVRLPRRLHPPLPSTPTIKKKKPKDLPWRLWLLTRLLQTVSFLSLIYVVSE